MSKIDFMAALPKRAPSPGDLGLAVGQTWFNRDGYMVTVTACIGGIRFSVDKDPTIPTNGYVVRPDGTSTMHGTDRFDLVERVTRVYIAGPMTGYPDLNFPAFHNAAKEYRRRDCFVINPAEINAGADEAAIVAKMTVEQHQSHWVACMRKDISALMTCDEIVMLDGWTRSKGANLEHHIARALGMTVHY